MSWSHKKRSASVIIPFLVLILGLAVTFATWNFYSKFLPAGGGGEVDFLSEIFKRYVLLFGIVASFALFAIILSLLTSRRRAVELAEVMTSSLKEKTRELETTEKKVEKEDKQLNAILSSMGEGLIAVSKEGTIMLMNQSAQALLGVSAGEVSGKKIEEILKLSKEDKLLTKEEYPVYQAMKGNDIARLYFYDNASIIDSTGRKFPTVLSAISILGKDESEGVAVIIVFRDVSLEKAVDEAKTEFVSLAAHQLRMPLTAIRWYAEMLLAGDVGELNKDQHSYLDEIYESNKRMVKLVNELLNVSRIRLGTFKIDPKAVDLAKATDTILSELQPNISKKEMIIVKNYNYPENFNADPNLLDVILENLISNAVKYTPDKGTITITFEERNGLLITVSDTGYGIPKAAYSKIFSQLYRADNIKGKDVEGTGLGLYMVKAIVDESGGSISFSSEENKGTSFHVQFPKSGMKKREGFKSLS